VKRESELKTTERKFDRVYLDTNAFLGAGWPQLSEKMKNLLTLARDHDIAVLFPRAVEVEIEEHWIRDLREKSHQALARVNELRKYLSRASGNLMEFNVPDESSLLQEYRQCVEGIKTLWGLQSVPITERPLDYIFGMATRQHPPFEEQGKGFQDAVIFLSCMDDLRRNPGRTGAFVSADHVFQRNEIETLTNSESVKLSLYRSIEEPLDILRQYIGEPERDEWEEDRKRAKEALEVRIRSGEVSQYIRDNLGIPMIRAANWIWRVTEIVGVEARIDRVETPPAAREDGGRKCSRLGGHHCHATGAWPPWNPRFIFGKPKRRRPDVLSPISCCGATGSLGSYRISKSGSVWTNQICVSCASGLRFDVLASVSRPDYAGGRIRSLKQGIRKGFNWLTALDEDSDQRTQFAARRLEQNR